ncbi:MAG: hypothetical protein IKZ37_09745 [Bacteroidaceae bacterium]|nr:hypothetical protein [Bacteroidaceae bacterium]
MTHILSASFAAIGRVQHRRSLCHAGGEQQNEPMTHILSASFAAIGRV